MDRKLNIRTRPIDIDKPLMIYSGNTISKELSIFLKNEQVSYSTCI